MEVIKYRNQREDTSGKAAIQSQHPGASDWKNLAKLNHTRVQCERLAIEIPCRYSPGSVSWN